MKEPEIFLVECTKALQGSRRKTVVLWKININPQPKKY